MRKMEVADIMTTLVPNFDMLSTKLLERIRKEKDNITFLKLKDPQIREIDRIWAIELFDCKRPLIHAGDRVMNLG